ncbi:NAD-binding protein [Pseudomonas akapageensis]|uniref:NAD-binding protein n=1 Tax=Pseudomonas akapageensis TaxID=2609961 RepID=UPI00140DE583|nr:NAD-binding protein [Pseudomonas akapageensis]
MNNYETFPESPFTPEKLTYLNAHKIAEKIYKKILTSHEAKNPKPLNNCLIFCLSHLSTTVNLSILNYWMSLFDGLYLIPKRNSLNANLLKHINDPTRIITPRKRSEFGKTIQEIMDITSNTDLPIIILDIGGYFSPYIDSMSNTLNNRLVLVLEDTANGHKKYQNTNFFKSSTKFKSVAYDTYKMAENVMVANIILAHAPDYISNWSNCNAVLVIGYGRIGRSLCFALRERGWKKITVVETAKARLFMAKMEGFHTVSRLELKQYNNHFEYCFSMSGHFGVTEDVFNSMRHNGYISVVTSYDDEFEEPLKKNFESGDGSTLIIRDKKVNIVNSGRPVNLSSNAAFDPRNLSLHFIFGKLFSTILISLGWTLSKNWEDEAYPTIISESQQR